MKNIILSLICILSFWFTACEKEDTTEKDPVIKPDTLNQRFTYADPGNILVSKYIYSSEGILKKIVVLDTASENPGAILQITEYDYDSNGIVSAERFLNKDNVIKSQKLFQNSYNSQGDLIECTVLNSYNPTKYRYEYRNGNLWAFYTDYNSINALIFYYTFSNTGILIKKESLATYNSSIYEVCEYTYDAYGNLTITDIYDNPDDTEPWQRFVFEYDASGDCFKETFYSNGNLNSYTTITYDSSHRLISSHYSDRDYSYRYEYTNNDFTPKKQILPEYYDYGKFDIPR